MSKDHRTISETEANLTEVSALQWLELTADMLHTSHDSAHGIIEFIDSFGIHRKMIVRLV